MLTLENKRLIQNSCAGHLDMYSIFANADLVPQFCVALIDICISSYQSVLWVMVHELVYDKDLPLNSQNLIICELTKG